MKKVIVRPVNKPRWHGKKGDQNFKQPVSLKCAVDTDTYQYATGLDNVKKTFSKCPLTNKALAKNAYLTEEEYYSKLLGFKLDKQFLKTTPHPFWDSQAGTVKLENGTNIFNLNNPRDYVLVKMMKANSLVANSLTAYNSGAYPEAEFYIVDKDMEVSVKMKKLELHKRAMKILFGMTKTNKIEILTILNKACYDDLSDDAIEVEINEIIQNRTKAFLDLMENNTKDVIYYKSLLAKAILLGICKKIGQVTSYYDKTIGYTDEKSIEFLMDKTNQDIMLQIKSKVEG